MISNAIWAAAIAISAGEHFSLGVLDNDNSRQCFSLAFLAMAVADYLSLFSFLSLSLPLSSPCVL
ncbi:hypothetical protein TIFTF001_027980 [Ficus carica]|uniref:Uncharacterized protein n=1 Tax=Ficus carica TaxID=3494 RepID=A0AA88IVU0_FICCA|nr:hypothetical protein TIFTF001_027980 [Ficus carica]